ncbi:MAG: DUF4424 domain-containing protein [Alphaproteobacteria bacterium]|jgi:hypothetical protein|nr:DUF4424 domain-containing protein [Alphaproteobacteria bacterium]MBU2042438.1 DUF4424 domain-containing protein [Alphaproteobacteria bacterium]MBU2126334.1 DUF4424 domain-containing protein [Alphaproteobacteria bacterium]MBU2207292.1 DUF4424 domain-containing protein [Alphaproteobacteria bacterium]MBU2291107.1 DUF4424 domain-containing protein [Alphaproteobacteria bacterium]
MIRLNRAVVVLAAILFAAPATANDSVASMGAGGLVLQRTDGIEMRSEDLYVSAAEIRVRYRFYNRTDRDIATLVAFPMPDLQGGIESDVALEDPLRMPFTTTVNGRRVATNVEQKAMLNGVDHSDLMRGLGVPFSPRGEATMQALAALPRPQIEMLIEMGLIEDRSWVDRGVRNLDLAPLWTLKTTHYWTQVFPAGRELDVRHQYAPAIGGSAGSIFGDPEMEGGEHAREDVERYCVDDAFQEGARRMRSRGLYLTETWVDYILTTGANWAEPIGEFRLVVDKGSSRNLVSFCGEGVRKIGSTRFEIRRRNYTPDRDLSVLILTGTRMDD